MQGEKIKTVQVMTMFGVVSPRGAGVVLKVLSSRVLNASGFRYTENQSFELTPRIVTAHRGGKVFIAPIHVSDMRLGCKFATW